MTDEPLDLGNPEKVKARKKKIISAEAQFESDLHYTLSEKIGRRLIWNLIADAHIFSEPHVPGDPHTSAFNNGKAAKARDLFAMLNTPQFADKYAKMISENNKEKNK